MPCNYTKLHFSNNAIGSGAKSWLSQLVTGPWWPRFNLKLVCVIDKVVPGQIFLPVLQFSHQCYSTDATQSSAQLSPTLYITSITESLKELTLLVSYQSPSTSIWSHFWKKSKLWSFVCKFMCACALAHAHNFRLNKIIFCELSTS